MAQIDYIDSFGDLLVCILAVNEKSQTNFLPSGHVQKNNIFLIFVKPTKAFVGADSFFSIVFQISRGLKMSK